VDTVTLTERRLRTDEIRYYLHDAATEERLGFSLVKTLDRAKTGPLFAGHSFFLTSNITPNADILGRVIMANGGEVSCYDGYEKGMLTRSPFVKVSRKAPSLRLLSNQKTRHLISCAADEAIWGPLVAKDPSIAAYTPELVLKAGLLQQVNWDSDRLDRLGQDSS
jgi:mediator of DNA damage checkpoint protein 1